MAKPVVVLSEQVYVVGDTPHDMEAAKAAGAVSAGRDHVLESLRDPFPGL